MLILVDERGGGGVLTPPFLADIICEQPLSLLGGKFSNCLTGKTNVNFLACNRLAALATNCQAFGGDTLYLANC